MHQIPRKSLIYIGTLIYCTNDIITYVYVIIMSGNEGDKQESIVLF